jgi:hypothetical protein
VLMCLAMVASCGWIRWLYIPSSTSDCCFAGVLASDSPHVYLKPWTRTTCCEWLHRRLFTGNPPGPDSDSDSNSCWPVGCLHQHGKYECWLFGAKVLWSSDFHSRNRRSGTFVGFMLLDLSSQALSLTTSLATSGNLAYASLLENLLFFMVGSLDWRMISKPGIAGLARQIHQTEASLMIRISIV